MEETLVAPQQETYHKNFTGCLVDTDGTKRYFQNGAYGREDDLPSIESADGSLHWYIPNPERGQPRERDAVQHRIGGPAIERANGDRLWYQMGKLHRDDDEPAVVLNDGTKKWFSEGDCVRAEFPDGTPIKIVKVKRIKK